MFDKALHMVFTICQLILSLLMYINDTIFRSDLEMHNEHLK